MPRPRPWAGEFMNVSVPKETTSGERRVALVPEVVERLGKSGIEVTIEAGAGAEAHYPDADYEQAGAKLGDGYSGQVVAKVAPPSAEEIGRLQQGSVLIGFLAPLTAADTVRALAEAGVTSFAMEAIPRISRAQSMDALQAIATARRLGGVVQAFDVRSAVKEQIESLGARFLELDMGLEDAEAAGGYARQLTDEEQQRQRELLAEEIGKMDAVISTAAVPGRRAPLLVTEQAVKNMSPGSVIVDLAAETGGNCELTEAGQTVVKEDVTILGPLNLPATMPDHASSLYARNVQSLLELMVKEGALTLDFEDEVIAGACITRDGQIVHEGARNAAGVTA